MTAERAGRTSLRRVGLAATAWPPGGTPNGVVTYVANARQGLSRLGVDSTVLAGRMEGACDSADVVDTGRFAPPLHWRAVYAVYARIVREPPAPWRRGYALAASVRAAHARAPLDLFEVEETRGYAWFAQGAIARPMVLRLHGPWLAVGPALGFPMDAVYERRVALEGFAIRDADALSAPSRHVLERVRRHYGLELPEAEVIPNSAVLEPLDRQWRYEHCDKRTILFVGRFDRLKGGDLVVEAFKRVAAHVDDVALLFAGPDPGLLDTAGKTWAFDEYLRANLPAHLIPRVRALGPRPGSEIAELRRRSFVTVVASRYETFPMTAIEALSCGSPLVSADSGGIAEIVEDGRTGLLFRSDDVEDFARKLLLLFADRELAARLGGQGPSEVARRLGPEPVAQQMCAFYERVVQRSPLGRGGRFTGHLRALSMR